MLFRRSLPNSMTGDTGAPISINTINPFHNKKSTGPFRAALIILWVASMLVSLMTQADEKAFFEDLNQLQTLLDVPHDNTKASMIKAAQKWRRKPGVERWEFPEVDVLPDIQKKAMGLLTKMGFTHEIKPEQHHFDYVLLLGATIPRMQRRLNQLIKLWNQGYTANQIISLTGQRPLTPGVDNPDNIVEQLFGRQASQLSQPIHETEGAVMIWATTAMPEAMQAIGCQFVSSPRRLGKTEWQRPSTRDTIKEWLKTKPAPGSVLVISDNPHALYQKNVVKDQLPEGFKVSVAAEAADLNTSFANYLDALALALHNRPKPKKTSLTPILE